MYVCGCRRSNEELEELKEEVALFKEAISAKDEVVVELTNKVFQLEHKGQVHNE